MIGSDFVEKILTYTRNCGECRKIMKIGDKVLASVNKRTGKVGKYVCSEECRLTFDDRFWQEVARKRAAGGR